MKRRCGSSARSVSRERNESSTETSQAQSEIESSKTQSTKDSEKPSAFPVGYRNETDKADNRESVHLEEGSLNCYEPMDYDLETWKTFAILFDNYCLFFCCSTLLIGALYFIIFTNIIY